MDSAEIGVLLSCISVFVATIMILVNVIVHRKEKKYIENTKVGDIFCFCTEVDLYYRKIEKYKHELTNPFDPTPTLLTFPNSTCIIKGLKESKSGEMWVCYNLINTPDEIIVAENTDILVKHYRTLDEFLALRERVERFEI